MNSCCFSSLESAFDSVNHKNAADAISMCVEESLKSDLDNHIDFANDILKNNKINEGEARVHYNLIKYKNKGLYNFLE